MWSAGRFWQDRPLPPPERERLVLASPNGFDACVAGVAGLTLPPQPRDPTRSPWYDPQVTDIAVLRRLLRAERPALDRLRAALRLEYDTPPARDTQQEFTYLAGFRNAAQKFAAESRVAQSERNHSLAMARALDAIELGSRIGNGGLVIHGYVGLICSAIGVRQAERCISALSADEARRAGQRLDRIIRQFPEPAECLEEDRRYQLACFRQIVVGPIPDDAIELRIALRNPFPPKGRIYRELDAYHRALRAEAMKPYRHRHFPDPPESILSWWFQGAGPAAISRFTENEAALRLLRLQLELQHCRRATGRYPERLDQLMPRYLAELPTDPYADAPFRYRPDGETYLLYSIGPDGVDDAGKTIPPRRSLMYSIGEARGDFVAGHLYDVAKRKL